MAYLPNILFFLLLSFAIVFFLRNVRRLKKNILLGRDFTIESSTKKQRIKNMLRIALGQSKMGYKPIAALLHGVVYVAFVVMNVELLEIILDGILGTHRLFSFTKNFYAVLIGTFEILAVLVLLAVSFFWLRRNFLKIKRFIGDEISGWPKKDANYILYFEMILMILFLLMNAADVPFQKMGQGNIISQYIYLFLEQYPKEVLFFIERIAWWLHITGILLFLNYLYYSKHLHIFLAFPNVYYGKVTPQGFFQNNAVVTKEVKAMLGFSQEDPENQDASEIVFGAKDITDLTWLQLMNAYTCTQCGRCTEVCPASESGKKLSPRNIMIKTRDCIENFSKKKTKTQ